MSPSFHPAVLSPSVPDSKRFHRIFIKIFDMNNAMQYQEAKKVMNPHHPSKPRGRPRVFQTKSYLPLEQYIIPGRKNPKNPSHLTRFRLRNLQGDFLEPMDLLPGEKVLYTELPSFHGYFEELFIFNPIFAQTCE